VSRLRGQAPRALAALALGAAAALPVACGSSGKGLIPSASAGPLQEDVAHVRQAAEGGNCGETETALAKTEQDFSALPGSLDPGLRENLSRLIANQRRVALELCTQPASTATTKTSTTKTTQTTSTATTPTTSTTTTPTTPTTPTTTSPTTTPSGQGGGTAAPGENQPGSGGGTGAGEGGAAGGTGAGGAEGK
jgi:hypothetical protein